MVVNFINFYNVYLQNTTNCHLYLIRCGVNLRPDETIRIQCDCEGITDVAGGVMRRYHWTTGRAVNVPSHAIISECNATHVRMDIHTPPQPEERVYARFVGNLELVTPDD